MEPLSLHLYQILCSHLEQGATISSLLGFLIPSQRKLHQTFFTSIQPKRFGTKSKFGFLTLTMSGFQLQQKVSSVVQTTLSVTDYFTQLNSIWEELKIYGPLPCCSCGKCFCKALECAGDTQTSDLFFKFWMGLNDSYEGVRGQILMMDSIPNLDNVFSMALQEERKREVRVQHYPITESSDMAVSQSNFNIRNKMSCTNCGKKGHMKEKCYRLVGFPPDFKYSNRSYRSISDFEFVHCLICNHCMLHAGKFVNLEILKSRHGLMFKASTPLYEHNLELRVKVAIEAEAKSQQRLAATEAEIADLRLNLDASNRINNIWSYMSKNISKNKTY